MRTECRRERGAAAVEMAIVLPLLLLILGGIIDFGLQMRESIMVTNAANEGVRHLAIADGATDVAQAKERAQLAAPAGSTVTVDSVCSDTVTVAKITVKDPTFKFLFLDAATQLVGVELKPTIPNYTATARCF